MTHRSRVCAGSTMEPKAGSASPQLSDEQWSLIADLFPVPKSDPRGGRPRLNARHCLEAFSGCCEAALGGRICHARFLRTSPAGDDLPNGP